VYEPPAVTLQANSQPFETGTTTTTTEKRYFCGFCGTPLAFWHESPADEADYIQLALGSLSPGDLTDLEELGLVPDLGSNPASGEIDAYARENPAEGDKAIKKGKGLSWLDQWLEESRFGTLRRATGGEETRTESGTVRVEWEVMEWAPGEGEGEWGECLGKRKFQEVEGGGGLQERPRG